MLASRFAFMVYFALVLLLNGWALLAHWRIMLSYGLDNAIVFLFNILSAPIVVWAAYRIGELAEEEFRRKAEAPGAPDPRTETPVAGAGLEDTSKPQ